MIIKRKIKFSVHVKKNSTSVIHPLRMRVSYDGNRPEFLTGFSVDPKDFDSSKNRMISGPAMQKVNAELSAMESRVTDVFSIFELIEKKIPTPDEFRAACNTASPNSKEKRAIKQAVDKTSFFYLFDQYMHSVGRQNGWTPETFRKLRNVKTLLEEYNNKLNLQTLTEDQLTTFLQCLFSKKYMNSYIAKILSYLNWFLRWAKKKGYYNGDLHETFKPRLKGLSDAHKVIIYHFWNELLYLYRFKLPEKEIRLRQTLDTYLFMCFSSLRHSDVLRLKKTDVKKDSFTYISRKGGKRIEVDLNKYSRAILDKYQNIDLPNNLALPVFTNQTMNDHLKIICELAKLTEPIHIVYWRANKRIDETLPKYELITTHCGRKTFIVNGIYLGISPEVIREWSGHADYNEMKPYIAIVDEQKKREMKKFDSD